jgi:hypothetical protein
VSIVPETQRRRLRKLEETASEEKHFARKAKWDAKTQRTESRETDRKNTTECSGDAGSKA